MLLGLITAKTKMTCFYMPTRMATITVTSVGCAFERVENLKLSECELVCNPRWDSLAVSADRFCTYTTCSSLSTPRRLFSREMKPTSAQKLVHECH